MAKKIHSGECVLLETTGFETFDLLAYLRFLFPLVFSSFFLPQKLSSNFTPVKHKHIYVLQCFLVPAGLGTRQCFIWGACAKNNNNKNTMDAAIPDLWILGMVPDDGSPHLRYFFVS